MSNKFRLLTFDNETQTLTNERVLQADSFGIETKHAIYEPTDVIKYYNETDGHIYYIVNIDLPSQQEAENLKKLRRSAALNNLFNYDVKKSFDLMIFVPYIIITLLILFK